MKDTMIGSALLIVVAVLSVAGTAGAQGDIFSAPFTTSAPAIDGDLGDAAWSNASTYGVTMIRRDAGGSHQATLRFMHDATYVYVGFESGWGPGWDVQCDIYFDGDNNDAHNGSLLEPHVDVSACSPSPGAYGGYDNYWVWTGPGSAHQVIPRPSGAAWASAGDPVDYEFKIPLSDLTVIPGGSAGFHVRHGNDGTLEHVYDLSGVLPENPESWATLEFAPVPEPATLGLLGLGGLVVLRRRSKQT